MRHCMAIRPALARGAEQEFQPFYGDYIEVGDADIKTKKVEPGRLLALGSHDVLPEGAALGKN